MFRESMLTTTVYEDEGIKRSSYLEFEAFTAMVMKSIIFWDMTPCSPLNFNRRFGGKYRRVLLATYLLAGFC
jgi:hypothetical protein